MDITSGEKPSVFVQRGCAADLVKKYVADTNAAILDIGCGKGFFVQQMRESGCRNISGADKMYSQTGPFPVAKADISYERLPFGDQIFDVVTAWEVFEHLENPYFAMREVKRVLKPDGYFFFSIPNCSHLTSMVSFLTKGEFRRWNPRNEHITILTDGILQKTFFSEFSLIKKEFFIPNIGKFRRGGSIWRRVNKFLPPNRLFGEFVAYTLKNH